VVCSKVDGHKGGAPPACGVFPHAKEQMATVSTQHALVLPGGGSATPGG
jgi:hypothetical protein